MEEEESCAEGGGVMRTRVCVQLRGNLGQDDKFLSPASNYDITVKAVQQTRNFKNTSIPNAEVVTFVQISLVRPGL